MALIIPSDLSDEIAIRTFLISLLKLIEDMQTEIDILKAG